MEKAGLRRESGRLGVGPQCLTTGPPGRGAGVQPGSARTPTLTKTMCPSLGQESRSPPIVKDHLDADDEFMSQCLSRVGLLSESHRLKQQTSLTGLDARRILEVRSRPRLIQCLVRSGEWAFCSVPRAQRLLQPLSPWRTHTHMDSSFARSSPRACSPMLQILV